MKNLKMELKKGERKYVYTLSVIIPILTAYTIVRLVAPCGEPSVNEEFWNVALPIIGCIPENNTLARAFIIAMIPVLIVTTYFTVTMWRSSSQQAQIMNALTDVHLENSVANRLARIENALTDTDENGNRTNKLDVLREIRDILIQVRDQNHP